MPKPGFCVLCDVLHKRRFRNVLNIFFRLQHLFVPFEKNLDEKLRKKAATKKS